MRRFILRRIITSLLSLLAATIVVFVLSRVAGDPELILIQPEGYRVSPEQIEALRERLGLNEPLFVQYFVWLGAVLRGDLGETIADQRQVSDVIKARIGATVQLGVAAWFLATLVGVPLGVLSAVRRGSTLDYLARGFALFGSALPVFWVAIVFILIFSVELGWLPTSQRAIGGSLWTQTQHFIMPTITLAWLPASTYLRLTRSAVLETLDTEYIKLARAKGLSHNTVIWKHAFRNALIQPLTVSALLLAGFITGAVLIEAVFAWPGLGRLAVQAIFDNEFPILMGVVLIFAAAYVFMNFLADLAYAWIDPRIRY